MRNAKPLLQSIAVTGGIGYALMPKREPAEQKSIYDIIKEGYEAVTAIAKDIHDMNHPEHCLCAICEIRRDDTDPEHNDIAFCDKPCFNCSIITCPKHPDNKIPVELRPAKPNPKLMGHEAMPETRPEKWVPTRVRHEQMLHAKYSDASNAEIARLRTTITNLDKQLDALTTRYIKVAAERDALLQQRELRSAGMHLGGKPLYQIEDPKPESQIELFGGDIIRTIPRRR